MPRSAVLMSSLRREIIAESQRSGATIPAATATVADEWARRRALRGDSAASISEVGILALRAGHELAEAAA